MNFSTWYIALTAAISASLASVPAIAKIVDVSPYWVAYQIVTSPDSPPKDCIQNPHSFIELMLAPEGDGRISGTFRAYYGVHVYSAKDVQNSAQLLARCTIVGAKDPLAASRVSEFRIATRNVVSPNRVEIDAEFVSCTGDWCDRKDSPKKKFSVVLTLEGRRLVMDDGKPGLADDYYHFVTPSEYVRLTGPAEDLARRVFDEGIRGRALERYFNSAAMASQAPEMFSAVRDYIGEVKEVETTWKHAMTYPDPKDPNEYMSVILLVKGSKGAVFFVTFVAGRLNALKSTGVTYIGTTAVGSTALSKIPVPVPPGGR